MEKTGLGTWKERRSLLIKLQNRLSEKFPVEDYNIFVFGSYIREDFQDGVSDIDIVVYCCETEKRHEIVEFLRGFFLSCNLPCDILEYDSTLQATVFSKAMLSGIRLTDYFPMKLKAELYHLVKVYERECEEAKEKAKYLNWWYVMKKYKEEN